MRTTGKPLSWLVLVGLCLLVAGSAWADNNLIRFGPSYYRVVGDYTDPPADLKGVALVHKALADPTRLRILQRLADGDGTVTDLMHHVDLSQPLVSWHLRRLRTAGLVETRRQGRETICSLGREALLQFHAQELSLLGIEG